MFRIVRDAYEMDPQIKHPFMNQFTVSIERELFKDTAFSLTYINRKWNNIIGPVDRAADYDVIDMLVPDLGETFQIYERTDATLEARDYVLKNIQLGDPWVLRNPYRKYEGIEVMFNKRFSSRWQLLASYVYSKASGTMDNGFGDDIGYGGAVGDPNFWVNSEGNLTSDPTHMIKLQGTYVLPFDINFNAYFRGITGDSWTTRFRTPRLNQGRVTFFAEPRGANHYPMEKILDLRLEKVFTLARKYRLGVMVDVFNVLNADMLTSWGTRIGYDWYSDGSYPSTDGHELYGIVRPRQARVGIRLIF